ncbi:hypothetical protein BU14_0438s0014 [Porphyra umbilicalis]|uniref:Uncharacterized protein n=1 Tax=Porphyra umbilicalis TaxID=2786 RepID=A0A1X6NUX6_PORUM|nr:hypothetical protein BU14_0438s0014 [Porphyra umbilicalis]|eukprot:OSX72418.1 hypothetical protein BU14_0438s0014 [Porphyra umbilicalis]
MGKAAAGDLQQDSDAPRRAAAARRRPRSPARAPAPAVVGLAGSVACAAAAAAADGCGSRHGSGSPPPRDHDAVVGGARRVPRGGGRRARLPPRLSHCAPARRLGGARGGRDGGSASRGSVVGGSVCGGGVGGRRGGAPPLAPSIRLVTDARPNTTLAPLDHPYTYVAMTLRVRNLPGGGYSDVLDAHVQDVIRKFWRDAAKPLAAVALVHAEQQGSVTATADATYYVAAVRSALQTMTAFNEYGGHATQVGSTAPPTVAATPTPAAGAPSPTPAVTTTPPPSPSAAPSSASPPPARFVAAVRQSNWNVEGGSAFGAELRKRPEMAATEAWLLAPLSNKVHVGEVGATVADGVVTPLPSDDKRAHPPILAISLAVGLSLLTAVVVLVGALIVRRRKAEKYGPWAAAARRSSAMTDAPPGRDGGGGGGDGDGDGDGGEGGGGAGGRWNRRFTMPSFSMSPPAAPPRVAKVASGKAKGGGGARGAHPRRPARRGGRAAAARAVVPVGRRRRGPRAGGSAGGARPAEAAARAAARRGGRGARGAGAATGTRHI